MIERPMPQDVMKYKAKLIGNLSMRQCVAVIAAFVVVLPSYFLFGKKMETTQLQIIISAIPAVPIFLIGFVPIMGLPAEKIAIPMFIDNFLAPVVRKKEIHNEGYEKYRKMNYDQLQAYNQKIQKALEKEGVSLEELQIELDEDEYENTSKKKKKKGDKFKVTKSPEYVGIK